MVIPSAAPLLTIGSVTIPHMAAPRCRASVSGGGGGEAPPERRFYCRCAGRPGRVEPRRPSPPVGPHARGTHVRGVPACRRHRASVALSARPSPAPTRARPTLRRFLRLLLQ